MGWLQPLLLAVLIAGSSVCLSWVVPDVVFGLRREFMPDDLLSVALHGIQRLCMLFPCRMACRAHAVN